VLLETSFYFTSRNYWLQSCVSGLQIVHDLQKSIICKSNASLAKHVEIFVEKGFIVLILFITSKDVL
jgi:hypothetical protein